MTDQPTSTDPQDTPPRKRGRPRKEPSRHSWIHARVTAEERKALEEAAERQHLTLGPYVISAALNAPKRRGKRRVPVERAQLAILLTMLGRAGGNLNQLAKVANSTGQPPPAEEMAAAVQAIRDAGEAIMRTLRPGYYRDGEEDEADPPGGVS